MRASTAVLLVLGLEVGVLALLLSGSGPMERDVLPPLRPLGLTDLSIATDCYSTRNPSTVDMAGCFRDLPGAMCYHASCAGFSPPDFEGLGAPMEVER
jgi:hypothetical protein